MSKFAVGFEKSEHVVEPDGRPAVGKAMPLVGRATVRRVDSNLRRFVRRLHRGVQSSAWRKAVVVLSLEKEDRRLRVLDRVQPELPMAAIRMASTKGCSLSQANAAVYGLDFAQMVLGATYVLGRGVDRYPEAGLQWLQRSMETYRQLPGTPQ